MKIKNVKVQMGMSGPDLISLITDLPEGIWPFEAGGAVFAKCIAKDYGVEYAQKHFSEFKIEVLDHHDDLPKWMPISEYLIVRSES